MSRSAPHAHDDEIQAVNDLAESFARKALATRVHAHEYPYACDVTGALTAARDAGLFGINLPSEWGGAGLDACALAGMLERISAVDAGMAAVLFTHAAAVEVVVAAASAGRAGARSVFQLIAAPDGVPVAFPSYTSPYEQDIPEVVGEETRLMSGSLSFLVLGGMARYAVVPGFGAKREGFSYYLVDLRQRGVTTSGPVLTLGLQACQAVDTALENVPALLLGTEGEGETYWAAMQSRMAGPAAAISLGIMEGSFGAALAYARQRYQGGRYIVDWSAVRMKLAEMAIQIAVAKSCLEGLSSVRAVPPDGNDPAVAAALHISNTACSATSEGVQLLGGNGYMKDYGQEKRMRDARQARSLLGMSGPKTLRYVERIIQEVRTCTEAR